MKRLFFVCGLFACATPAPVAPTPPAPTTAEAASPSRALFVFAEGFLVPLACYDGAQLRTGAACLDLVPPDAVVRSNTGKDLTLQGRTTLETPLSATAKAHAAFAYQDTANPGDVALWPPSWADTVRWEPDADPGYQGLSTRTDWKEVIQRLAPSDLPAGEVALHQTTTIDGVTLSAVFSPPGDPNAVEFGAVVARTASSEALFLSSFGAFTLLAALDLDGDGQRELLSKRYSLGNILFTLDTLQGGKNLARWGNLGD